MFDNTEIRKAGELDVYVPTDSRVQTFIYNEIFEDRVYEHSFCKVTPGDVVVDIGANIGLFTLYAVGLGASLVHAIEAEKTCVQCIRKNIYLYGAVDKVVVYEMAAWHEKSTVTLNNTTCRNVGSSWVNDLLDRHDDFLVCAIRGKISAKRDYDMYDVEADTVDNVVAGKIDFVKVDTEGSESEILIGMRNILSMYKPKLAIAAYHRKSHTDELFDIVTKANNSYRCSAKDSTLFFY